jgi:hypothetical protein
MQRYLGCSDVVKLAAFVGVAALLGAAASASAAPNFQGENGGRQDADFRRGTLSPTPTQRTLATDGRRRPSGTASEPRAP